MNEWLIEKNKGQLFEELPLLNLVFSERLLKLPKFGGCHLLYFVLMAELAAVGERAAGQVAGQVF